MKSIYHIKTTIIGVVLLLAGLAGTFLPFHINISYEANTWVLLGLYLSGVSFILLDPATVREALKSLVSKVGNKL